MSGRGFFVWGLAAFFTLGAAPLALPLITAQIWTAPGAGLAYELTHEPAACTRRPQNAVARRQIEMGRLLFRTSALLGGPAARIGLSCNACHSNARRNTAFLLPELTNRAGTADVTSEWASKRRGDGVMNPRPIPDLVNVPTKTRFGSDGEISLERFVHGVIEDEFQGKALPASAFRALIAYLRAQDLAHCDVSAAALTLKSQADDVRAALEAARAADPATARLLVRAGQETMGRIVERLPGPGFAADRARLEALARELNPIWTAPEKLGSLYAGWMARFDGAIAKLTPREQKSYFNMAVLQAALGTP